MAAMAPKARVAAFMFKAESAPEVLEVAVAGAEEVAFLPAETEAVAAGALLTGATEPLGTTETAGEPLTEAEAEGTTAIYKKNITMIKLLQFDISPFIISTYK